MGGVKIARCKRCRSSRCPGRFGDVLATCWTARGFIRIAGMFQADSEYCPITTIHDPPLRDTCGSEAQAIYDKLYEDHPVFQQRR